MKTYTKHAKAGRSFVVMKHARPLFKISAVDEDDRWKVAVDFTKLKQKGIDIDDLLRRLR